MTDIDKPVVRRTQHLVRNRRLIATLTPGGLRLRLEGTQQTQHMDYITLWNWMEKAGVHIPPRKK